jgi:phytol kinase
MPSPWLGILLVVTVLGVVLAALKCLIPRLGLAPETSRKMVHILMGLLTLSFPWLFDAAWPVLLLALLAVTALTATRVFAPLRQSFGGVLHGVERQSLGEIYFPLAVALLFLLADGNPLLYTIPLLTLTLADAVAALVGVHYGQLRFATSEGTKSVEGSFAFFTLAFLSAHVPLLLLSDTGRAESLLIALVLGLLVMLFEAISVGGLDNLFIPLGCYALLRRYLTMGPDELLVRLGAICLLALLVLLWRRRTTLKESGLLAAALTGYMNWALGGWSWLAVSLILFLTYTHLWPRSEENSLPVHTVRAVASVAAPGLLWLLARVETGESRYLFPFILVYGVHSVVVGCSQLGYTRPEQPIARRLWQAAVRSWLVFLPTFFLPVIAAFGSGPLADDLRAGLFAATVALPLLLAAATIHLRLTRGYAEVETGLGRWFRRAGIALGTSLAGWGLSLLVVRL